MVLFWFTKSLDLIIIIISIIRGISPQNDKIHLFQIHVFSLYFARSLICVSQRLLHIRSF